MILLSTYKERKGKQDVVMVSHGFDTTTDRLIVLPIQPLFYFDHHFDSEIGEYILDDPT